MLGVLAWLAHWPSWSLPTWRGTEGRRVQIAAEMRDARAPQPPGMVPTLGLEPTLAKPPLYYWSLVPILVGVGPGKVELRAVSIASVWLLALLAWLVIRERHGGLAAWIAASAIITTPAMLDGAPVAEIDPMFAGFTGISLLFLARAAERSTKLDLLVSAAFAAAAMLTKAFPFLMFAAGAWFVALRRQRLGWRGLAVWFGCASVPFAMWGTLAVSIAAGAAGEEGGAVETADGRGIWQYVFDESVGRLLAWQLSDVGKLLEYVGLVAGSLFVVVPFVRRRSCARLTVFDAMLLAGALSALVILLVFPHRPPRYFLPAIPLALCALSPAVARWVRSGGALFVWQRQVLGVVGVLGAVTVLGAVPFSHPAVARLPWFGLLLAAAPFVIVNRGTLLAFLLVALPVGVSWTILGPVLHAHNVGVRSSRHQASVLRRYVSQAELEDFGTHFHPPSQLFVELGTVPVGGDEQSVTGELRGSVVLLEEPNRWGGGAEDYAQAIERASEPGGYRPRVRVMGKSRMYVLRARRRGR